MGSIAPREATLEGSKKAPGNSSTPYKIPAYEGEVVYIPASLSTTRFIVTDKETDHAWGLTGHGGTWGEPVIWHLHRTKHDLFMMIKGEVHVWAGDQCRALRAGDFASIPPNTPHSFQHKSDHSEFLGLTVPGGYEDFYRWLGEPNASPLGFPQTDDRKTMEVMSPQKLAGLEQFDFVPIYDRTHGDPQPWSASDDLPGTFTPYFLHSGQGQRYLVGGSLLCKPICTLAETDAKFGIASIEGSALFEKGLFASNYLSFGKAGHCIFVADGIFSFSMGDGRSKDLRTVKTCTATAGEAIYVPVGCIFKFEVVSKYAVAYMFCNDGGFVELIKEIGVKVESKQLPEKSQKWDRAGLHDPTLHRRVGMAVH